MRAGLCSDLCDHKHVRRSSLQPDRSPDQTGMKNLAPNPSLIIGAALVILLAALAALGPWLASADPLTIDLGRVLDSPSPHHLLGCDALGRDMLARTLWGARLSLAASTAVATLSFVERVLVRGVAGIAWGGAHVPPERALDGCRALSSGL